MEIMEVGSSTLLTGENTERMGVSAISFEDKIGLKQNSLLTNQKKYTRHNKKLL